MNAARATVAAIAHGLTRGFQAAWGLGFSTVAFGFAGAAGLRVRASAKRLAPCRSFTAVLLRPFSYGRSRTEDSCLLVANWPGMAILDSQIRRRGARILPPSLLKAAGQT